MGCNNNLQPNQSMTPQNPCTVSATELIPITVLPTATVSRSRNPTFKGPVVLAEPTLQIVVESTITLIPAATEIKRVKKHVFLDQVKLVPVAFQPIPGTDFFDVTRAKLYVSGHIRKNIEYSSTTGGCNGPLQDQIVDIPFTGFTELNGDITFNPNGFILFPIIGISESAEANFLNEQDSLSARLDKFFFQNLVKYNEQPFGELIAANFYELDFSPTIPTERGFRMLTEKIVLDLTIKVLQVQQFMVTGALQIIPSFTGLTPPVSPSPTPGSGF